MYRQHSSSIFQKLFNSNVKIERFCWKSLSKISSRNESAHQISSNVIQLKSNGHDCNISTLWLRHHCRCPQCFNTTTNQRSLIPSFLKENGQLSDLNVDQGQLKIRWKDDHVSLFECQWLMDSLRHHGNCRTNNDPPRVPPAELKSKGTKDDLSITEGCPLRLGIEYKEFMSDYDKGLTQLLSNVREFGYGLIVDAPPSFQATNEAILRISHPQTTIFGGFYEFTADMSHADTAYSSHHVHLHTDTTYFSESIGLQVFHCLYHEGDGGVNSIVDGYKIAQELHEENPRFYQLLTNSLLPWQYVDPKKYFFRHIAPIFTHHQLTGQLECVRYNPHDMALLNTIDENLLPEFYDCLVTLSKKIEESPRWIKLKPGMILFLDNWRMLHGRNTFTGIRKMCGSYISRSDWLSKCRILNIQTNN